MSILDNFISGVVAKFDFNKDGISDVEQLSELATRAGHGVGELLAAVKEDEIKFTINNIINDVLMLGQDIEKLKSTVDPERAGKALQELQSVGADLLKYINGVLGRS